jgi:hypothetical protein
MLRYFVYCGLIALTFVYCGAGGQGLDAVHGKVAFVITAVLWLACMAIGWLWRSATRKSRVGTRS